MGRVPVRHPGFSTLQWEQSCPAVTGPRREVFSDVPFATVRKWLLTARWGCPPYVAVHVWCRRLAGVGYLFDCVCATAYIVGAL
jgi:hypothetical protein